MEGEKVIMQVTNKEWIDVQDQLRYLRGRIRTLEGRVTKQQNIINELRDYNKQKKVWRTYY
jgi:TolA-binding protein